MNLFTLLDISGSALQAERQRAEVAASNLTNAETTRTAGGGPYKRQEVVFGARRVAGSDFADTLSSVDATHAVGVRVERVVEDATPPIRRFNPSHPDADAQGYVSYPAINPLQELVDLMGAARAYELNVAAVQSTKAMIVQSLQIIS